MDYFKLFTLVLGFFAFFIATQQFRLSRHKAKLELFDLRYNVYDAVRVVRGNIISSEQVSRQQLNQFRLSTCDSRFLFGEDVQIYLDKIASNLIYLILYSEKLKNLDDPKRDEYIDKESELMVWFAEMESKNRVFDRYMDLSKPSF
jgi:hypothetical protein